MHLCHFICISSSATCWTLSQGWPSLSLFNSQFLCAPLEQSGAAFRHLHSMLVSTWLIKLDVWCSRKKKTKRSRSAQLDITKVSFSPTDKQVPAASLFIPRMKSTRAIDLSPSPTGTGKQSSFVSHTKVYNLDWSLGLFHFIGRNVTRNVKS